MKVDRYTKFVLTVIALALSTLAFKDIVAPQPAIAGAAAIQCSVPSFLTLTHRGFIGNDAPAPSPDSQ